MDLFRIDPSLRKNYSEKSSHFTRNDSTQSGSRNDLAKFATSDILSSSSWSSVIHQPAQDSEPEDLPSTVDIDAIKEPPTPVNASAQTPARQFHGDEASIDLSDDQNAVDSGSDSDSDTDSGNSENEVENTASCLESGSYSDSDSASSHRSSSSSKDKRLSSQSSRSNTPPSNSEDQQQFSVCETNLEQGGLKMKLSTLNITKFGSQSCDNQTNDDVNYSSDSSESKDGVKKRANCPAKLVRARKQYPLGYYEDLKNKSTPFKPGAINKSKRSDPNYDSDSSSSSLSSPSKRFTPKKGKPYELNQSNLILGSAVNHLKSRKLDKSFAKGKEEKLDKITNELTCYKTDSMRSAYKEHPNQLPVSPTKYRRNKSMFSPPILKLPQVCKLSEDSDDSNDMPKIDSKNDLKKNNNGDSLDKLAQQLTRPSNSMEHLQILNEEDLAAVLPEVGRHSNTHDEELSETTSGRRKTASVYENKKPTSLSDSSSDTEMIPKQNQILSDAINSIHVDSDLSNDSPNSSIKHSTDDSSSSLDKKERIKDKPIKNRTIQHVRTIQSEPIRKAASNSKTLVQNTKTMKVAPEADKPDDLIKVPPYLGSKTTNVNASNLALFHGKRGPGRPKKCSSIKLNGKANFEKTFSTKLDSQFPKTFGLAPKSIFTARAKSKKQKYRRPVVMCLENPKKRRKKKNRSQNVDYHSHSGVASPRSVGKEWQKKHKKHKKKNSKEKNVINSELLIELESLADIFNKKCVIEDKKQIMKANTQLNHTEVSRPKFQSKSKERNSKKRKQSDWDSDLDTNPVITTPATDLKSKRRHKKSAIETPKVLQNNCDQRLPLKKRHYHISTSSTANNNHQTHVKTKIKNDTDVSKPVLKSMDVTKARSPSSPKTKVSTSVDADIPPVLEECNKVTKDDDNSGSSSSLSETIDHTLPSIVINKLQTSNQPQLITPLPSESTSLTPSPGLKPPAGVFEPTRKLPASVSKCKKNSIDDVLSKLKEKLKDLESPLKNTSTLIEKMGSSKKETDCSSSQEQRILRSKRASIEKENINAKKTKLTNVTVRLRKLSSSELISSNSSAAVVKDEEKPKLKRRKIRNRTGFPVKKKKKLKKVVPSLEDKKDEAITNAQCTINASNNEGTEKSIENQCPLIMKNESASDEMTDLSEDDIPLALRHAPVLQPIENASIQVKNEIISEDEMKSKKCSVKNVLHKSKSNSCSSVSMNANKLLPSRASVRIHIKKQMEEKKIKKSHKKNLSKKKSSSKKQEKTEAKLKLRTKEPLLMSGEETRKIDKKEIKCRTATSTETKECDSMDKGCKGKDDTDKEELSDDSMKQMSVKKDTVPKRRKKFLHAGLFSEFYKEEKSPFVDPKNRFALYKPKEHPHGLLPPPPYFDDWVRGRQVDYTLPYDLWWLHKHDQLPGRAVVDSWKYKRIMKNTYNDVKPTNVYETQACNCEIPSEEGKFGCGDDCINRVVYAECSPSLCRLKERCSNQRIQKNAGDKKLVQFMTADKGIGVKTEKPIKSGEYILEYVGEVVTDKEFKKRMTSLYKNDIHHYCLNLDGGLVIDGHRSGSDGRFVNHSCEPNCEMQKWTVDGYFRMALFALRDIEAGEEITYDYNFALFNPEEGQPCRCGSVNCRGVIGGKSQRVSLPNSNNIPALDSCPNALTTPNGTNNPSIKKSRMRPRKQVRKTNNSSINKENHPNQYRRDSESSNGGVGMLPLRSLQLMIPLKPLSPEEIQVVKDYRIFLLRSLNKVQRIREKIIKENNENPNQDTNKLRNVKSKPSVEFLMQLNALSKERFIRTRGLAQVEDNPEMTKTLQLAKILRTMYNDVVSARDERDEKNKPYSTSFLTLPSKRRFPQYYTRVKDPINLTAIENNIITGVYKDLESFDIDMNKLITNNVTYYGRISDNGIAAVNLRKAYNIAKLKYAIELEETLGHSLPPLFKPEQEDPGDEEEDVIRCICGLFNDEGLMIQCERCLVWQHCDCVRADTNAEDYLCERCNPRDVDYDIPLDVAPPDYPKPDEKHYLTLKRDDLQIRQGDAVYVLRSIPNPETGKQHNYQTIKTFKFEDCDIFRVEQLWKTNAGDRFSFGHHYLRPHETFHEPTRKFYPNEVLKVPLYETVPLELIMGRCHVLDPNTYCKGKPIDADPQHIYICEYRVDKEAKLFYKIPKSKQLPVCMKNYAFEKYETRLKPSRTYAPHGDPKPTIASNNISMNTSTTKSTFNHRTKHIKSKESSSITHQKHGKSKNGSSLTVDSHNLSESIKLDEMDVPLFKDLKVDKQKQRLNSLLLKLLAKKSTKGVLDASYLLDMGRRNRKKLLTPTLATPAQN